MWRQIEKGSAYSRITDIVYVLYCNHCYQAQEEKKATMYLNTPDEVEHFIEEYGPFSDEETALIIKSEFYS